MKITKIASILLLIVIIAVVGSIAAFASSNTSATVSSSGQVARGDSITFSVQINNGNRISGIAIIPSYDKSIFELVSGEWIITGGLMPDFSVENGDGVIAFSPAQDINTKVLTFTLKAKSDAPMGTQTVSADVIVTDSNGNSNLTVTASTVEIQCKHNYSTSDRTYLKSEASCSSPALYYKICLTCGEHATETFTYGDTLPHTPGPEATENTAQQCTVCGHVIVPALGHTHNYSSDLSSDANSHWYACSGCGEKKDEGAHVFDNDCDATCNVCSYEREITHAFGEVIFYDDNSHWQQCALCGEKASQDSHSWDNGTLTQEATETHSGIKTYSCENCNAEKIELTPVITNDSNISDGTDDSTNNVNNPTFMIVSIVEGVVIVVLIVLLVVSKKKRSGNIVEDDSASGENNATINNSDTETDS